MSNDTTGVIPPHTSSTLPETDAALPSENAPEVDQAPAEKPANKTSSNDTGTTAQPSTKVASYFGWIRSDMVWLCLLAVITLGLMGWKWASLSRWGAKPIEIERLESRRLDYKIDINSATWVEWIQFEGIGETLAERIVADRKANGPFESIDDLQRVKGIGPKTIARIRQHLKVETPRHNDDQPTD